MTQKSDVQQDLPPLSPREFRIFNRGAERMAQAHNYFRLTWQQLEDATNSSKKATLSPKQLIMTGLTFISHISSHHAVEEQYVFPMLGERMPEFADDQELREQHRRIHQGLDQLEEYLERCRSGETELSRAEVKRIMDGFAKVLWEHLDDEVNVLRAENMRKYWTLEEVEAFPG